MTDTRDSANPPPDTGGALNKLTAGIVIILTAAWGITTARVIEEAALADLFNTLATALASLAGAGMFGMGMRRMGGIRGVWKG